MREILDHAELEQRLGELNAGRDNPWRIVEGKLHKTFTFEDFTRAFGFMTQAAIIAEKMDHHPEWRNVYRTVEVDLVTHSSGGITALDVSLAQQLDNLAG